MSKSSLSAPRAPDASVPVAPLARRPVGAVALATFAVLLVASPRYGYHRDEMYFRMLGEQPALGYFDTPPLTPLIARASIAVFGDTVIALRVVPALIASLVVVLVALLARELGGDRRAQILAAAGIATTSLLLIGGHSLLTLGVDLPFWVAAALFAVRALRGDGRWWLALGAVAGVATYNRQLIVLFLISVGVGVLVAGPREILRDRRLWFGALLALVIAAPNLFYQATHDWPQLTMAEALEVDDGADNRLTFLPLQLMMLGPPQAVLQVVGAVRLWREPRLRCLPLAYLVACALTLYSGGRPDYVAGLLILLFAAGCGPAARWMSSTGRRALLAGALAVNAVVSVIFALPVMPPTALEGSLIVEVNEVARESIGWPEFAARVGAVVGELTPQERAQTVLLAHNYGEAGALDRYAEEYGLPEVYSGHNELYWRGPPPPSARIAVVVTDAPRRYGRRFATCEERGRIDNGVGLSNEEQHLPILLCRDPVRPWQLLWPEVRNNS